MLQAVVSTTLLYQLQTVTQLRIMIATLATSYLYSFCMQLRTTYNRYSGDNFIMYSLLLLSSLLHITTCTVYTVTPDDHYYPNTTCHHCHNLQHYLLNVTKYFTSNTQLLFLPGLHHLHTDLIIQNVHNISLIGSTADGTTPDTVIQCMNTRPYIYITITNVSMLIMKNLIFKISHYINDYNLWLTIKDSLFISMSRLQVKTIRHFILNSINILGSSHFNHIVLPSDNHINLLYNETHTNRRHHIITLNDCEARSLNINMLQKSYKVTLKIVNAQVQHNHQSDHFISAKELGISAVLIMNYQFISNVYEEYFLLFASSSNGSVQFIDCEFFNNKDDFNLYLRSPWPWIKLNPSLMKLYSHVKMEIINCKFASQTTEILQVYSNITTACTTSAHVLIKNTSFIIHTISRKFKKSDIDFASNLFTLSHTILLLEDLVVFGNITTPHSIISLKGNSRVIISGLVEFSNNHVNDLINFYNNSRKYIIVKENSIINVTNNVARSLFATSPTITRYPYSLCLFQYLNSNGNSTIKMIKTDSVIIFCNNQCKKDLRSGCYNYIPITHCLWLPESLFNNTTPLDVNSNYMQFINKSGTYKLSQIIEQSSLCMCTNESHYDCHINDLGYLYPGQTLIASLYYNKADTDNAVVVKTDITQQYVTPCIVLNLSENLQIIGQYCTRLHYTIGFSNENQCDLFLKIASDSDEYLNIFSIKQMTCPTGFVKIDRKCQCDPILVQYGITNCNINNQTILRPANSWISATTHNNSYTYHISLHCPFHYCLPHSSYLYLSTPNTQCQFNRSGLLCGHCRLSTVFSSPHCQHCSNIYLLLIIPIAIAGLALVLLLFVLNLTVTDGTINGFILYANIISINTPVFFTELNHFTPTYTFISLANLDLGIQTCFYNGMDDYAKMWLQLAFPFYLIFIATLIIITSRYSTTIQRLTARRALPVLATLFLLSYTKILRIVSSVLFFYSTITHLPSKHTTLVWSVDANVPLFGVRFTILFIVCLILLLILIPFNVILLFTRALSRFKFINKFKPLLDAYQGPYKDKYFYWAGMQLVIRSVLFGVSSLDRNTNVAISIIVFSAIIGLHGTVRPFKIKYKNYQELLLFLNLQVLYVNSLYDQGNTNNVVTNIVISMAAVHFTCIITYHMVTYMCGGVIRSKIQLMITALTRWITRLHHKSQYQQFQPQNSVRDNIPEVAFKFYEFREPLVGQDN